MPEQLTFADAEARVERLCAKRGWDKLGRLDQVAGLAEECGEVCKDVKIIDRKGLTDERRHALGLELADVQMYVLHLAKMHGIDLPAAFDEKMQMAEAI